MQKKILMLSLIVVLMSCTMSETRIYTLHLHDPTESPSTRASVKRIPGGTNEEPEGPIAILVNSPKYLTQPYIAYRGSPYQLGISKYARWDSSPDEIVQTAFKESLASSGLFKEVMISPDTRNGSYSLTIALKNFERTDEGGVSFGEVAFEVNLLSPDGKNLYQKSVAKKMPLADRSFLSLAKGLSNDLAEGVAEVRTDIEKSLRR